LRVKIRYDSAVATLISMLCRNSPERTRPLGLFTFQLGINVSYTAGGGAASGLVGS